MWPVSSAFASHNKKDTATENCLENLALNHIKNVVVKQGTVLDVKQRMFDLVLANITKTVILEEIIHQSHVVNVGGFLVLSGFFKDDLPEISSAATENNFTLVNLNRKNNWIVVRFIKNQDR